KFDIQSKTLGITRSYKIDFEGVATFITNTYHYQESANLKRWAQDYMDNISCPECNGTRLRKESLYFKINEKNIAELAVMDIEELQQWFINLPKKLSEKQFQIAEEILKEVNARIRFLTDVGLNYLSLNRSSKSLSGGE